MLETSDRTACGDCLPNPSASDLLLVTAVNMFQMVAKWSGELIGTSATCPWTFVRPILMIELVVIPHSDLIPAGEFAALVATTDGFC